MNTQSLRLDSFSFGAEAVEFEKINIRLKCESKINAGKRGDGKESTHEFSDPRQEIHQSWKYRQYF